MAAETPPVEEVLAWEAEQRPRVGLISILAGSFTLIGGIVAALLNRDLPSVYALDAIRDVAGEPIPGGGLLAEQAQFYADHKGSLIAGAVISSIAAILVAPVLGYLFRAVQARRPEVPRVALWGALAGPVLYAFGQLVHVVARAFSAQDFVDSKDHSSAAAHGALYSAGGIVGGQLVVAVATLLVGIAFVLIALNAMRVGLLTRFMGVLGILVGALPILPLVQAGPLIEVFWLIALGWIILGRWPTPLPAWETGRAEPWPSNQQLREARERAERPDMEGPSAMPDVTERAAHSSSKKKKRKR